MKTLSLCLGLLLLAGMVGFSQDPEPEYLTKQAFQAEKKRADARQVQLQYELNAFSKRIAEQQQMIDSLLFIASGMSHQVDLQSDSLTRQKTDLADLSEELSAQKQRGLLLVILIPAFLLLIILLLYLYMAQSRKRIYGIIEEHKADTGKEIKQLEETLSACEMGQSTLNEQFQSSVKKLGKELAELTTIMESRIRQLEERHINDQASQAVTLQQTGDKLASLTKDIQQQISRLVSDINRLKDEMAQQKPD